MMPTVSIVLSCYKRGRQLRHTLESIRAQAFDPQPEIIVVEDGDDGLTETVAKSFRVKYFKTKRTDWPAFQNPSRIHNIGIRRATGSIIILQGGEVMFETKPHGLEQLVAPVVRDPNVATTPIVQSLDKEGRFLEWYCAPDGCSRAGWIINFCLAVDRHKLLQIGGFEESYTGYGFEDSQFMFSLQRIGVKPTYVKEVLASHQWHERANYVFQNPEGSEKYDAFVRDVESGRAPVANVEREWGRL